MPSRFLQTLNRRSGGRDSAGRSGDTIVFDGSMGATIQSMSLDVQRDYLGRENCVDILVKSRPDVVARIHEDFLAVGSDAVETDTFGANKLVFAEFDQELVGWTFDINKQAAEIARASCDKFATSDKPRFVIGSIGPGTKLITLGQTTWEAMLDSYTEQARGLLAGGVDAFIIETCQDLLQTKCAINACLDALKERNETHEDVPIMASVSIETMGKMLVGSDITAVVNALSMFPICSLGLNCSTGPVEMGEHLAYLSRHWGDSRGPKPISVMPNAGLPILVNGKTNFPLTPDSFAASMARFVEEFGVSIVGGCCGTTPEHIRQLIAALSQKTAIPQKKVPGAFSSSTHATLVKSPEKVPGTFFSRPITPLKSGCSSLYNSVDFVQESSFLIVAERTNSNGSRKFKKLLDEENWDGLVSMARDEVKDGSHLLDVCVDFVGRNGVRDMSEVISRYIRQVNAPIMLDSTQADVLEAGLKRAGGKCIVNSINLEDGEKRFNDVCPLLKRYGAACVALTIDEDPQAGMAKTAARKLAIAERMHDLFVNKWGFDDSDLLFDPLTFTIATGVEDDRRLGLETLSGIELIAKRFPNCGIILGLSNISFGLKPPARAVLNSVFLHEARQRGLTAAIVHASKILPRNKIDDHKWQAAQWLIFDARGDRRPENRPENFDPLLYFISLFPEGEEAAPQADIETLSIEEQLQRHIIDGEDKNLDAHLIEAMKTYSPLAIINDHLLAGMKVVGDLFGSGQMQLPFVLQSAQVMKKAVSFLEPHMEKATDAARKAKIVLATVQGDVHDIGKNLVDIILTNNGYEVHNLGIKQPITQIVEALREVKADAIGMSGLLVKSVGVMEENLHELNRMGFTVPVLVGGAALTRHYAESHLRGVYKGPLYYGKDAFEGLRICEHLADNRLIAIDAEIENRLTKRAEVEEKVACMTERTAARKSDEGATTVAAPVRSKVATDVKIPQAPFYGDRLVENIDLDEIYPYINTVALFRGQWGFKKGSISPDDYKRNLAEVVEPLFERMKQLCKDEQILRPAVVYGYFPCNSSGDDLIIYDPEDHDKEIERFKFPRQSKRDRLCISDFFRPIESGEKDVVSFHCVTMGVEASHRAKQLFERNEYTEYLYIHGIGVETTEALAELWHKRIRAELGIDYEDSPRIRELFTQHYRGSRYSFGYPACPDMSDQEKLFRLLNPERIGCTLTENWQIVPEQSTSAIIVHHPQAKYFSV
ncbi:MAG: homocysteine S-methyltransferase family protein [Phycisphaerales bacterium]|nr:homocysteine S-methyltransferase family protein [Phycisphaerales bacterium]